MGIPRRYRVTHAIHLPVSSDVNPAYDGITKRRVALTHLNGREDMSEADEITGSVQDAYRMWNQSEGVSIFPPTMTSEKT